MTAPVLPITIEPGLLATALENQRPAPSMAAGFANLLTDGLAHVEKSQVQADALVRQFVLNEGVPLHQVTFALEQARLSLELMTQVRSRLIEGFQTLMNMPL